MPASEFQSQPHVLTAERRWITLAGVALVAAAFAVYWNSLSAPFVFDDREAILENATIRQLWPPSAVLAPPAGGSGVVGRPIVNLTLALNYAFGGEAVWGYHALNLALHAMAGLVLFGLLRRTLRQAVWSVRVRTDASLLAGTIALWWVVHPLQTESVTCVVQRTEVIVSLFYLLVLYCVARSAESDASRVWQVAAIGACALGMASKEVMVTAPVVALLYDRTFLAGTWRETWRRRARLHAGLIGTWAVLAGILWELGGSRGTAAGFGLGAAWWSYALKQGEAIVHYLWLLGWPHPLVLDYGTSVVTNPLEVWPQLLAVVAALVGTVVALMRRPVAGFAGAAFFVVLAPSSSVVPLVAQTMAEHRMYLALALPLSAVVIGLHAWRPRASVVAVGFAVSCAFALVTMSRNESYRDEIGLWRDTIANRPDNPRAHLCLAMALLQAGRVGEAKGEFEATLKIRSWDPTAHANLGQMLSDEGRFKEARWHMEQAIKFAPKSAPTYANLCDVLVEQGAAEEAIRYGEKAVELDPAMPEAHCNLGRALATVGKIDAAIAHYHEALRLRPNYATAGNNLAVALMNLGRQAEALEQIENVLRSSPADARSHNTRAVLLANLGRRPEAVREFERALELKPDDPVARENLRKVQAGLESDRARP